MRNVFLILATLLSSANAVAAKSACTMHVGWWIYPEQKGDIWLSELHCGDAKHWRLMTRSDNKLLAKIPVPPLPAGYRFNYGQCTLNGELRNDIIAIVRYEENTEWSTDIPEAWLLDPIGKTIKPMPPKGLSCRFEGYGLCMRDEAITTAIASSVRKL